jgi:hypothetical protein
MNESERNNRRDDDEELLNVDKVGGGDERASDVEHQLLCRA